MNIKQIIVLLLASLGASFSAQSAIVQITSLDSNYFIEGCALSVGLTMDDNVFKNYCNGKTFVRFGSRKGAVLNMTYGDYRIGARYVDGNKAKQAVIGGMVYVSSCPAGQQMVNGVCEEPVVCEGDTVLNPDTGLCENIPFCDRQSTIDQIIDADNECHVQGGTFVAECNNGNDLIDPFLDLKCVMAADCVIGSAHWPECLADLDPTKPVTPPSGGFNPDNPDTSNPKPPGFDKPEPDDVIPEETTDTAVLEAIQNMNRDHNAAATALNTDLNTGFSDVNNKLSQLSKINNEIGVTIDKQMKQDFDIHEAEKQLLLQQTGAIMAGDSSIVGAINSQTDSASADTRAIISKLNETRPCDPNTDPLSCEGASGMNSTLVKTTTDQINDSVNSSFAVVEAEITQAANSYLDESRLSPIKGYMDSAADLAIRALPDIGDCTSFSLPSPFGGSIDFGCEFSVKFKAIASFLMYIYTLWTLIDILLNGVTPVSGTVPYLNRR
ncbi:hypothetical protein VII00023_20727 [Vibrio ichthyoenteri ATCC 700023]|uniref:Uncharacterized protein n=1 Tax=Vibrio ichthyoenteri ATCC 700023 TaxID=870968 RepID=F9S7V8_9VIBR|nr:hypothetical protein [Vibrio ichthyoenteri]EGU31008.1 hypothetical protein VII00023_20727 [Vibrio ichthyoenteri ATCC 700023]